MEKQNTHNKGFSFIELLIAVTILSIVMLMIVNFMSMTTGAYRKTKKNVNIQTEALQVMEQMSDSLMQAAYVQVSFVNNELFDITYDNSNSKNERKISKKTETLSGELVPDNYRNYLANGNPFNMDKDAILDMKTFQPIKEDGVVVDATMKSFRALNQSGQNLYVRPEYIYMEYMLSDVDKTHVIYKIDGKKIYLYKYDSAIADHPTKGFEYAKSVIDGRIAAGEDGLLTEVLEDIYLSADVEGNSLLVNILFEDGGYEYNSIETIKFRNSNVLTVRPQRLFRKKQPTTATSTSTQGSTQPSTGGGGSSQQSSSTETSTEVSTEVPTEAVVTSEE